MDEQLSIEEDHLRMIIDEAIKEAAHIMDLQDIDQEDQDLVDATYDERYHCGTCTVRVVMEHIWPSVENYIDYLKKKQ